MKFKLMVNNYKMKDKAQCTSFTGAIKNNKSNTSIKACKSIITEMDIKELEQVILNGQTIIPAILKEGVALTDKNWQSQQVFGLDFDNDEKVDGIKIKIEDKYYMTSERILDICKANKVMPAMIYETFSSKESLKKYRVIFIADKMINSTVARNNLLMRLAGMFIVDGKATTDASCKDLSRIFFAGRTVVYTKDVTINTKEVIKNLEIITETIVKTISASPVKEEVKPQLCMHENVSLIKAANSKKLKVLINQENITFESEKLAIEFMKTEIDMAELLGLDNSHSFKCVIHNDNNPSAGIIVSDSGQQIYMCLSSNCGFKGDIISVVAELMNTGRATAIRFIKEIYAIKVEVPEYIKLQQENLEENIRMLMSEEIKDSFPDIHSVIWRYYKDLIMIQTVAKDNLGLSKDEKNVIFYIPQKTLASLLETRQESISRRMAMLAYLNLCVKIDDIKVPKELLLKAKAIQAKNNVYDSIQFYSIPSYTWSALKAVSEKAKVWKEKGLTMMAMSRELIYRTFGEEEADRVYPKRKNRKPTEASNEFQVKFELLLLKAIKKNGYSKELDIVAKMNGWTGVNQTMAKRILAQSLSNLSLKRVRATKALKEEYSIKGIGCPFIIIAN